MLSFWLLPPISRTLLLDCVLTRPPRMAFEGSAYSVEPSMLNSSKLFPHKEWLSVGDVVKLSGHSYIWVNKYLGIHKPGISKVALAKLM